MVRILYNLLVTYTLKVYDGLTTMLLVIDYYNIEITN